MRRFGWGLVFWYFGIFSLCQSSVEWGLDLITGFPQGDMKSETTASSLGLEGSLGYHTGRLPLTCGLMLGYLNLGSKEYNPSASTAKALDIQNVRTSYNAYYSQIFLKVHHDFGSMEPYFEMLAGYQSLKVESAISFSDSSQSQFSESLDHGAPNFGLGGGTSYFLYKQASRKNSIQLTLGFRYTIGTDYEFLDPESLALVDGNYQYLFKQKNVPLFLLKAGLHFIF